MFSDNRHFFLFLGVHSFLIGLFPFFLPVFLWKKGLDLATLSLFIALTGCGFMITLWQWDRLYKRLPFNSIIVLSFVAETALMSWIFAADTPLFLPVLALLNGAYNCFFWLTQRALFFDTLQQGSTGRSLGNFQIYVAIILKAGIFSGSLTLEQSGYGLLYALSALLSLATAYVFLKMRNPPRLSDAIIQSPNLSCNDLLRFKDNQNSRFIFLLDGIFLYLESYFWMISLFLISHQDFWKLGLLVIILSVSFSLVFFFIKNHIDRMPRQRIYFLAVTGYALSWSLRAMIDDSSALIWLFAELVVITFLTSFFRLAFNKAFFEIAQHGATHRYLIVKSYYSQFSIAVVFTLLWLHLSSPGDGSQALPQIYFSAALCALGFLVYRLREPET